MAEVDYISCNNTTIIEPEPGTKTSIRVNKSNNVPNVHESTINLKINRPENTNLIKVEVSGRNIRLIAVVD